MDPNHFDDLVKSFVRPESRIADVAHRRELSAKERLLDSLPVIGREAVPRRSVLKVVSALAAGGLLPRLVSPGRAAAVEEADAKCEVNNDTGGRGGILQFGQTFRAKHTGLLTRATITALGINGNEVFDIEIRKVNRKGKITTTVLASETGVAFPTPPSAADFTTLDVTFTPAATVRKDKRYALVLRRQGTGADFNLAVNPNNQCSGTLFEDATASGTFVKTPIKDDMVFATFVTTGG